MERRHQPAARNRRSGVNKDAIGKVGGANRAGELPHIVELIEEGQITIGTLEPAGCVATASDGHNRLAMLVRRKGETLTQLLIRLDRAIGEAFIAYVFTDEINTPPTHSPRR